MTCEEFKSLLLKDPRDCTSAERIAFVKHEEICSECRIYIEQKIEEYEKTLTIRELNYLYNEANKATEDIIDLRLKDSNDPETNY